MSTVLVHYDVPHNFVLLETFVRSAKAAEQSVSAINKALFDSQLSFELVVLAPESGTLKQYIGITLKSATQVAVVVWALVQVMDSPSVREISKELFGATPSEEIIERIRNIREAEESGELEKLHELEQTGREIVEDFVSRSARRALEIPRDTIVRSSMPDQLKYELESAQSALFAGALEDPNVSAIGFSEEEDFPIQRNQFAERAVRPTRPKEEEPEDDWRVSTQRLRVTSPNFDKDDQAYRKWKAKAADGSSVLFEVWDEEFWLNLHRGSIEFSETTEIEVQLATLFINDRASKRIVLRVLRVDQEKLAKPLSDDALATIIGNFSYLEETIGQSGLFDESEMD